MTFRVRLVTCVATAWVAAGVLCAGCRGDAAVPPWRCGTAAPPHTISGHFALQTLDGREVTDAPIAANGCWSTSVTHRALIFAPRCCCAWGRRWTRSARSPIACSRFSLRSIQHATRPQRLSKYMAAFNSHIVGLRGSPDQTTEAARQFHVYYSTRSLGNGDDTLSTTARFCMW